MAIALSWFAAYLVGAIPFGYLVARARGVDIFSQGSGNIGATNVGRVLGKRFGILVFLLDFAKGALPVITALVLKPRVDSEWAERGFLALGTGLASFLGHLFPVYLRFRGGKGVATGAGVVAVLFPWPALAALLAWVVVVASSRYVSLASVAAALVLCTLQLTQGRIDEPRNLFCLLAATLVVVKHRANLVRLKQGKENRLQESASMNQLAKTLHVLAMGMWFGTCVFFTFMVTLSLFNTFETLGQAKERPAWFPVPAGFARIDAEVNGPREQGSRVAGHAVGPMFPWYFLVQGVCGLVALFTALGWSRSVPRVFAHRMRAGVLLAGLLLVLIGWPLEHKVSELRVPRNEAMDAYLRADNASATHLNEMKAAKGEFFRWHAYSLLANFATMLLVTVGMALAARLPADVSASRTP